MHRTAVFFPGDRNNLLFVTLGLKNQEMESNDRTQKKHLTDGFAILLILNERMEGINFAFINIKLWFASHKISDLRLWVISPKQEQP